MIIETKERKRKFNYKLCIRFSNVEILYVRYQYSLQLLFNTTNSHEKKKKD